MRGLGKFLFGGLLGALFGFFVSPKRAQLARDALLGQKAIVGPTTPRVLQPPRGVVYEPESALEPEDEIEPAVDIEPEAVAAAEPEAVAATEPEPAVDIEPEAAASAEPQREEPEYASEPQWEESEYEAPAASPPAQVGFAPTFSVSKPSIPADVAEQHVGESPAPALEVESAQPEPQESELELEPVAAEAEVEPEPESVEAEVEPERESVEPERESVEPEPESVEAEVEPEPEPELVEAEVEPEPEPVGAEVEPPDTGPDATSTSDSESAREQPTPPVTIGMSDLKARIEETRRRIQRELEQPFATEREALVGDEGPTFGEHPVREPEEVVATSFGFESFTESEMDQVQEVGESAVEIETYEDNEAEVPLEPVVAVEEQAVFEPQEEAVPEPSIAEEEPPRAPLGADSEFDHDAMRRRIEETRNRLKAKAFDAMMKGESALLAHDADPSAPGTSSPAGPEPLDSEVAETIETTLSEEDI